MISQSQTIPRAAESSVSRLLHGIALAAVLLAFGYALYLALAHAAAVIRSEDLAGSNGDYSNYAEIARVVTRGGRLYVDYWTTKPPGVFLLLVPFVSVFGPTFIAVNLAIVTLLAAFTLAVAGVAYQVTRSRLATLVAVTLALLYTSFQDGTETTFLAATLSAWAMWAALAGRGRALWMLLAGALFTAAFFSKQPVAIEAPVLLAFAVWRAETTPDSNRNRIRAVALVIAGGLVSLLAFVGWMYSQGTLEAMWDRAFALNFSYVLTTDGTWHFNTETENLFERYFIPHTLHYLLPLFVLGAASAAVLLSTRWRRAGVWIVIVWALLAFVGASVGRAFKPPYYNQILPSFITLIVLGVPAARRIRVPVQVPLALLVVVMVVFFERRFNIMSQRGITEPMTNELPVVAYLQEHTGADECVWMWGHLSYMNYLADRRSCSSQALNQFAMDPTIFPITRTRIEYMHELINARPTLHVQTDFWGYFPELQKYADRYLRSVVYANEVYEVYAVDRSAWHPAPANFDNTIALIGYDLPVADSYCPGDTLALALTWEQRAAPRHQYQAFVQVLTADEQARLAGVDVVPAADRSTDTWTHDREIILGQTFDLPLPDDIAPGTYPLVVGLYDVGNLDRLNVLDASGQPAGTYAHLQTIHVDACD